MGLLPAGPVARRTSRRGAPSTKEEGTPSFHSGTRAPLSDVSRGTIPIPGVTHRGRRIAGANAPPTPPCTRKGDGHPGTRFGLSRAHPTRPTGKVLLRSTGRLRSDLRPALSRDPLSQGVPLSWAPLRPTPLLRSLSALFTCRRGRRLERARRFRRRAGAVPRCYIIPPMPPMPPIPPMPPGPPGIGGSGSGFSVTSDSVVRRSDAMLDEF